MLILDSEKVVAGRVRSRERPDGCAGVMYRDLLFVKGRAFSDSKRQEAVRLCQEVLDSGRFCILLKENAGSRYTLCYQVKSGRTRKPAPAPARKPTAKAAFANRDDSRTILQRPVIANRDDSRTILQRPVARAKVF